MSLDPVALVVLGWAGGNLAAGGGKYLQDRAYRRLERVFGKASAKTEGPIDANDRVKIKVFAEAAFTDDDLTLEYLAGVLAASGPDEDTGASVIAQIGRLSAMQLRLHYVVYRELRRLWPPEFAMNLYMETEAKRAGVRIPVQDLWSVIGPEGITQLGNCVPALVRESLLNGQFEFDAKEPKKEGLALRVRPSGVGAELFLWGHGIKTAAHVLFDPKVELDPLDIPQTPGASLISPPAASGE